MAGKRHEAKRIGTGAGDAQGEDKPAFVERFNMPGAVLCFISITLFHPHSNPVA